MELTEYDQINMRNLWVRIWREKDGRQIGRYLDVEIAKKRRSEPYDYAGVKRAILDKCSEIMDEMWLADQPKTGR